MKNCLFLLYALLIMVVSYGQEQIASPVPDLSPPVYPTETLPESEINIPVQIDLTPFFALANKKVDTLFTSPDFPNAWVQDGCAIRYKYSFRRGPLQFSLKNTTLDISFTGYYKIIGSTRGCVNGKAITPWTPACQCGFEEGERKVKVGFTIDIALLTNYTIKMQVTRREPEPLDRCNVCFWGQDITSSILDALKKELDQSKAAMEKAYGRIDLKPRFQDLWNRLNSPYNVSNMGWLQVNPQKIRVNSISTANNLLQLSVGLAAKPVVRFEKPAAVVTPVPHISNFSREKGFQVYVDMVMNYDSLSRILTSQIKGKEFVFSKAFIKKRFVFQECRLLGNQDNRLVMQVKFTGTDNGFFYVTGKPLYYADTRALQVTDVDFDLKSKDALLKTADWLFSKKITHEIEKMAKYDLTETLNTVKDNIRQQLNQEFIKGVSGTGSVNDISVAGIFPQTNWLAVRAYCNGNLILNISGMDLSL
ncbi:hypothetical protein A8C56_09905 [Niabella ginsenosidivorans]|uniref:DUF4403 domain-containing protein n=1 Tax=Niabella ginsenosidivorans TaxID=1176587 RepID=A0A1A9I9U7_9BACT|nr:DUF4403 family protein [Niabella ginsenosidivorans]ANH83829.1 hypothetical protein A8C56_09905 [Niabella ginsenosidivorans]